MSRPNIKMRSSKHYKGVGGILDGMSVLEMSREQLEPFILRIQREIEREREERNFFQLERNKIRIFWEITRQQVQEYQSTLRNKSEELEQVEEKYEIKAKNYEQRVKNIIYENQNNLSEIKIENMIYQKHVDQQLMQKERQMIHGYGILKYRIIEEKMFNVRQLKNILLENKNRMESIYNDFQKMYQNLDLKHQHNATFINSILNWEKKAQVYQSDEREGKFLKDFKIMHRKKCCKIFRLHSEITRINMNLITSLSRIEKKVEEISNICKLKKA